MAGKKSRNNGKQPDVNLMTSVDDATFDELVALEQQRIAHTTIWEESLADALAEQETDPDLQTAFDIDLYLSEGVYFELYAASIFTALDAAPVEGDEDAARLLLTLVNEGLWLDEIAVDEEENLVLVLGAQDESQCYLTVGGWLLEEWDELPG